MVYFVYLTEPFEADVARLFDWLFEFNAVAAFKFRDAVEAATTSLSEFPNSYPTTDESSTYVRTVRRKLFKSGSSSYRILFTIYEAGELDPDSLSEVHCLRIFHGAARPMIQNEESI